MFPIISILLTKYSYTLNINLYIKNVLRNILMTILIITTSINFIHSVLVKRKILIIEVDLVQQIHQQVKTDQKVENCKDGPYTIKFKLFNGTITESEIKKIYKTYKPATNYKY